MATTTMVREATIPAARSKFVSSHICLALLFAVTVFFQIGFIRGVLREVPADVPEFMPRPGSASIGADHKALRAGLYKGDILVAINGHPYTGFVVWIEEQAKARPGETMLVTVRSPGTNSPERTISLPVVPSRDWLQKKTINILFLVLMPAFCIALGFWVVLVRPADLSAWLLLGVLLGFSQVLTDPEALLGWGPKVAPFAAAYSETLEGMWAAFMFLFGFYFPEPLPLFQRPGTWWRWLPAIVTAPFVILCIGEVTLFVLNLRDYRSAAWLARALHPFKPVVGGYVYLLMTGFFGFIFTKSMRVISPDSRRRLRLLYWGATIAMTPGLVVALWAWLAKYEIPNWVLSITFVMFALFPLTLAYVIVVQRAMDVRMVLRQGMQYALAKNGIVVLQIVALSVVASTFFALTQHHDTPAKLSVIALGSAAIFLIRRGGDRARGWLDRRFFREAYDAEQVLSELGDSVRRMVEVPSMLATVAECISHTLHIPQVAVLVGGGGPYRPAYALGYASPPDIAFLPGAGTVKVLARQGGPARVYFDDPQSWLHREPEVTEDDRAKLAQLQSELLLPLNGREQLLGFISLGPKRSDEPYSRTDLRLLKSVAMQTGLALENAHLISAMADEVAQRERLNSELQIAREVQERLFPQKLPPIAGILYAGACRPASGVGGDYYDFLALPAGRLGIAIGDVSGKGIAAALTMASLQASLRSEVPRASDNLAGLMCNVNRLLQAALASNRYATFFYAQYDPASRQLMYVNAGHNPPMLFRCQDGGDCARLEACGTVVGLLEGALYEQRGLTIAPGDVFVAFTDGISEAMNDAQDEFGEERLMETVRACAGLPPAETIARIMQEADAFAAGAKQNDDMTLVVLCAQSENAN